MPLEYYFHAIFFYFKVNVKSCWHNLPFTFFYREVQLDHHNKFRQINFTHCYCTGKHKILYMCNETPCNWLESQWNLSTCIIYVPLDGSPKYCKHTCIEEQYQQDKTFPHFLHFSVWCYCIVYRQFPNSSALDVTESKHPPTNATTIYFTSNCVHHIIITFIQLICLLIIMINTIISLI